MSLKKNKYKGLLAGILIGFGISLLIVLAVTGGRGLNPFPAFNQFFKKVNGYLANKGDVARSTDFQKGQVIIRLLKERTDVPTAEAWMGDTSTYDSDDAMDELFGMAGDSTMSDSLRKMIGADNSLSSDRSLVKRDVLMGFKIVTIKNANIKKEKQEAINDSVLVESNNPAKAGIIRVEFWQSPLNYKGYKANKSKIVLFGLEQDGVFSIKKFKNILFLQYAGIFYQLDETEEHRPFQKVKDPALIKQLAN
ncbi:MAG: hypothetical protein V2A54_05945 [Bacteroidota bacterium]